jgi:leader peptidase (prepilin peptidase) / N-methyltransferase
MPLTDVLAASPAFFVGSALLLGLIVGSFLNVVIHRLPIMLEREWREQCEELARASSDAKAAPAGTAPRPAEPRFNLIVPRSACPACGALIRAWQNIPVISYLLLRGRCAQCSAPISVRYPAVELVSGVASAVVAWKMGFGWPAAAALVLTWFLIALAMIDIDEQLLPDQLTLPLLWIGLLLSLAAPSPQGAPVPVDVRSSLIGAAAGYLSLWSVYHVFRLLTGKEGMGYGDFKLLGALGAWLGWQMLLPIVLTAALVGAVVGGLMLSVKGKDRGTPIPFGPFLAGAGWLMLLFGHEIVTKYLGLFPGPR